MQRPEPSVSGRLQRRNLVAYPRDCRARFSDARVGARERPLFGALDLTRFGSAPFPPLRVEHSRLRHRYEVPVLEGRCA